MGTVAIFMDGGYLDKVIRHDHAGKRIDYERLIDAIAGSDELLRSYYYHCLPYRSNPPTAQEQSKYDEKRRFFAALRYIPRFDVRLGQLVHRGVDAQGQPIFQQKRVDIMLGVDMTLLAGKGRITRLALLSGDSDCIPAIEAVKNEGVVATLWHGGFSSRTAPSRELAMTCDERRELTPEFVDSIPLLR